MSAVAKAHIETIALLFADSKARGKTLDRALSVRYATITSNVLGYVVDDEMRGLILEALLGSSEWTEL